MKDMQLFYYILGDHEQQDRKLIFKFLHQLSVGADKVGPKTFEIRVLISWNSEQRKL